MPNPISNNVQIVRVKYETVTQSGERWTSGPDPLPLGTYKGIVSKNIYLLIVYTNWDILFCWNLLPPSMENFWLRY